MRDEHMVICSPAVFELISPDSPVVPVKVELTYDSRDPYAVQASFRTGHGTAVDWVFARDLLADGLMASSGTGDVRVQPMPTDATRIELELNSPSGHALFTTCAQTLGEFLDRTYESVPRRPSTPGSTSTWRSPSSSPTTGRATDVPPEQ